MNRLSSKLHQLLPVRRPSELRSSRCLHHPGQAGPLCNQQKAPARKCHTNAMNGTWTTRVQAKRLLVCPQTRMSCRAKSSATGSSQKRSKPPLLQHKREPAEHSPVRDVIPSGEAHIKPRAASRAKLDELCCNSPCSSAQLNKAIVEAKGT